MSRQVKQCSNCGEVKSADSFHKREGGRLRSHCKQCMYERKGHKPKTRMTPDERKRRVASNWLRYRYGITIEDYERMLAEQNNQCAICGVAPPPGRRFHTDHNHATGVVRGLLCQRCNIGLWALEDQEFRPKAERYLGDTVPMFPMKECSPPPTTGVNE